MKDLKKTIAEIVLEELEKKNEKLIELMKNYEDRLELDESDKENFVEETTKVLKEHLGLHDDTESEPTKAETELERMRRLI